MKPVHITLCTEKFENDDPNHLCRVGLRTKDLRLFADCFITDESYRKNLSVDRKIAALEVALEKLFEQVLNLAPADH